MTLRRFYGPVLAVAIASLTCLGCKGDMLTDVGGTLTLDGKPLEGAIVRYVPAGSEGQPVEGITDEAGRFRVDNAAGQGVRRGSYKVVVIKDEMPAVDPAQSPAEKMEARMKAMQKHRKSLVPARYTTPETTPFSVVAGDGSAKLDMTSAP